MRRIGTDERRARLALRHRLAASARADDPVDVARSLVGIHASDPASVFLGLFARLRAPAMSSIERALYEDRTLVRVLGMRRTLFVMTDETAPVVFAAATRTIAARERRRLEGWLETAGVVSDAASWLARVEDETLAALRARGEATAAELSRDVPELREQIPVGEGKSWQGTIGVSTRVLMLLAADGRIVRGRPRGTWISRQYRWAPVERWLPGGFGALPTATAQAELARRWLAAFGPATLADLRWWTGWTVTDTRRALAAVEAVDVDLGGTSGFVLPDDLEPPSTPDPWVALLPALDTTTMGWTNRGWYLGEHAPALFDRNGNAGPTIWADGRVVGGWGQRGGGEIAWRLLEDIGTDGAVAVAAEAARLGQWIGHMRVTPTFRTPLELELGESSAA